MAAPRAIHDEILVHERRWVILRDFLKHEGYELRARYQPDWVPSWYKIKHPTPLTWKYEDGEYPKHCLIDAIRIHDGARVMLKLVKTDEDHSEEIDGLLTARGPDPRNHCLPLLAVLHPPEYPGDVVLVTPYCLPWALWPFVRVSEAVDFFAQIFEGLAFMHENNVAHLDASYGNIVMDAVHLYQEPFHPMRPRTRPYGTGPARHLERHQSERPIKYYFIDFEGAVRFDVSARPLVKRRIKQDKTVPEERDPNFGPCDPFAVDVYCLGNVVIKDWLGAYKNVEFIRELAQAMTSEDPAERPTATEILRRFEAIRASLPASELQQALVQVPLYHSFELRGKKLLAEHRKQQKAEAAAKRAARKKERAEKQNFVWRRLGDMLSNLLPSRRTAQGSPASAPATPAAAASHQ